MKLELGSGDRPAAVGAERCACGESDCVYLALGYPYCRSCDEHHRPPECPVDEEGYSINQYGERWEDQ